jgi:hypothetical protein
MYTLLCLTQKIYFEFKAPNLLPYKGLNYCACLHSVIKCRIVLQLTVPTVGRFSLYKSKQNHNYCWCTTQNLIRCLFQQLDILPVPCQYVLAIMNFHDQQSGKLSDSCIYNINTSSSHHLHRPIRGTLFSKMYILCWHEYFQRLSTQSDSLEEWQGKIQRNL